MSACGSSAPSRVRRRPQISDRCAASRRPGRTGARSGQCEGDGRVAEPAADGERIDTGLDEVRDVKRGALEAAAAGERVKARATNRGEAASRGRRRRRSRRFEESGTGFRPSGRTPCRRTWLRRRGSCVGTSRPAQYLGAGYLVTMWEPGDGLPSPPGSDQPIASALRRADATATSLAKVSTLMRRSNGTHKARPTASSANTPA